LITAEMDDKAQVRMAKLTDKVNKAYRNLARTKADELGYADRMKAYFAA